MQTPVKRRARCRAGLRQLVWGLLNELGAKRQRLLRERAQRPIKINAPLQRGEGIHRLAKQGAVAIGLGQTVADGEIRRSGHWVIKRDGHHADATAQDAFNELRSAMAEACKGEGGEIAAFGVKAPQPGEEVCQQVLAQILPLVVGDAACANDPERHEVGEALEGVKFRAAWAERHRQVVSIE